MAVAYSNCNKFYIGEILKEENNIFEISFLTDINGDNRNFTRASNPRVETAHCDQVFQKKVGVKINGEVLTLVQTEKINGMFVTCKAKLLQKEKIEKVMH